MLKLAERLIVRIQDFTGIPRWKWLAGIWRLCSVVIALRVMVENRSRLFLAGAMIIALSSFMNEGKDEQRLADRTQMIVANPKRNSRFSVISYWFMALWVVVSLLVREWLAMTEASTFLVGWLLSSANTFPMQGGAGIKNLFKRLKSAMSVRRPVTNET